MSSSDELSDLARMRISYSGAGISEVDMAADWVAQFHRWLRQALNAGVPEPNAMVLATADATGRPASRTVLAKAVTSDGVTFFTNFESAKSADLSANPRASCTFPWYGLHRQVHVVGHVLRVAPGVTQAYWKTRPRGSQLGAWASPQSTVLASFAAGGKVPSPPPRQLLDQRQAEMEQRFGGDSDAVDAPPVPVPPHWGGWRVVPESVEFWQGRLGRMHDRLRYRRTDTGAWLLERLAP